MMRRGLLFFALPACLLFGHLGPAQEPPKATVQEQKQEITKPAYEVEVVVTNVHVVVRDKSGKSVTGLKLENFRVYEDSRIQKVTNFFEVKGMDVIFPVPEKKAEESPPFPAPPLQRAPRQGNKVVFYFDNSHLHPMNRNWSIDKLESFIRQNFPASGSNNQGQVVCFDQKISVLQDFTSDADLLLAGVKEVKQHAGGALLRARTRDSLREELNQLFGDASRPERRAETYEEALGYARNYVEAEQSELLYSLKSLQAFVDQLTGIDGKKILIYISDGLPINPAEEVFSFLDQAYPVGSARSEALNYDATRYFKELTAKCNMSEVTIYPINAQGLETSILSADKKEGWDTYSRGSGMIRSGSREKNAGLQLMAQETGGLAIVNSNKINVDLEKITEDLNNYYSLGYVSLNRREGEYHTLRVELEGVEEDCDLRVRQGYMWLSQEEKIRDAVFSRLFLERPDNPMNLRIQVLPVEKIPLSDKRRLTLKILIPLKSISLYQQDGGAVGQIKLYIFLMDAKGQISPCHELSEEIKIPKQDYEIALRSVYPYLAEMHVSPGQYTISLAVRDVYGETINYLQVQKTIEE